MGIMASTSMIGLAARICERGLSHAKGPARARRCERLNDCENLLTPQFQAKSAASGCP
jgi:hypothetical protein